MQAQRAVAVVRREELSKLTSAVTDADSQIKMLTPTRDQSKAAADQATATLATLGPALEPLKQAATAAAAKATELAAQHEAARADLARWQDETVFLGRYQELAGVIAAKEALVREAEAKVAEGQAKVAADEQSRQMLMTERQTREKELAALNAAVAKAKEDHAALLQKIADTQAEMTAGQATMNQLGKAVTALEAAAVSAKSAVDAAPDDSELAGTHATLVKTVAAKAAQIKTLGESQAAMAAAKAAREKEAADMTARAEKLKADMPAVTARMQELDGMIVKAATVVESSTAAVRSLEPEVAERQKQVDAAVGELSALQGLRPGT